VAKNRTKRPPHRTRLIKAIAAEHKDNEWVYRNAHLAAGDYFCPACGNQNGNKRLPTRAALRAHYREKHLNPRR
jgi:hypothetical protein